MTHRTAPDGRSSRRCGTGFAAATRHLRGCATAATALCLAGPTAAHAQRMQGFDAAAASGDTIEISVPGWMNGAIKAGGRPVGSVRRLALGTSEAVSLFGVTFGGAERFGRFRFDVDAAAFGDAVAGDCIYHRTERRLGTGSLTISQPLAPLLLQCRFVRGDRLIGRMVLEAAPRTAALVQPTRRVGEVEFDGVAVGIESVHRLRKAAFPSEMPVGYRFLDGDAGIGAVDLTGVSRRVIAVPRQGPKRAAALAAAVALSVFWDPADTDD